MTASINGTTGVTFPDASVQGTAATGFGFKNRIINGAMMIDQRNAGAAVTSTGDIYTVDRWAVGTGSPINAVTVQQSTTAPAGFSNSLVITAGTGASAGTTGYAILRQAIEGFNVADLNFGSANAKTVSISFWVRSSLTGTFGLTIRNSAGDRAYGATYTISAANTFEYKTVTIPGDTTGTWLTTNGIGIHLIFDLGAGSTYDIPAGSWQSGSNMFGVEGTVKLTETTGATWYITGVQLEKGSTATSFDYRPYGTELALCQRYYWKPTNYQLGLTQGTNVTYRPTVQMPVTMRSAPTLDSGASYAIASGSAGTPAFLTGTGSTVTVDEAGFWNSNSNWSTGQWVSITCGLNAEL